MSKKERRWGGVFEGCCQSICGGKSLTRQQDYYVKGKWGTVSLLTVWIAVVNGIPAESNINNLSHIAILLYSVHIFIYIHSDLLRVFFLFILLLFFLIVIMLS